MSFGINLSRFIYSNIIFKHKDSFANDMIIENDFNFNSIKDIQNEINNNFINLFLLMTKNSYITKDKFIKQIDDNIEKIKGYYDKKYIRAYPGFPLFPAATVPTALFAPYPPFPAFPG